jgi:Leucine-rich repeat (LRR) protein
MNNIGLTSVPSITFSAFKNLEELNLAGNKLTTIAKMGLEDLKSLRILDVSKNMIDISLKELGALINKFPILEIIALRENPVMKNLSDRLALISFIPKLREATAMLRVIDTEISVDERVEAWKKNGGSKEEVELMRSKALYFLRTPADVIPSQLTGLDMSYGGLSHISLSDFLNLEFLSLKQNYIKSINDLEGIQLLNKLKMLDLRKNLLSKLEEIPPLLQKLPNLKSIGLKGNKFCENKNWRQKLLSQMPELHETQTELRLIDDAPITVCL